MFYKNDDALNNNIYNEYSDLYALGVVLYQLCFYEFPFDIIEQEGKYELKRNPEKKTDYSNDIKNFINQL
jgi:serine/threonine protein kinase